MRQATLLLLTVIGVATLSALFECAAGQTICPHCVCPPSFAPVCGYRSETNTKRGFSSRCVLDCSNKCRKHKYEFVFNGRCGKWTPSTTSTTTTTTTTTPGPEIVEDNATVLPTYDPNEVYPAAE